MTNKLVCFARGRPDVVMGGYLLSITISRFRAVHLMTSKVS